MQPLVILPGWGHGRESWEPLVERFAPREVRILELPGFGGEPLVSSDWGVPEYAAWVRSKIESERLSEVILLGHSFGGRIAAHIASERPAWLSELVLYAAPCLYRPSIIVRLKKSIVPIALSVGLKGMYHGNPELTFADKRGLGQIYRRVVGFDQADALRGISVPTLIVWGEKDGVVPIAIAQEMNSLIPNSQLQVLSGLVHNAHIENSILFAGVVSRFLATHEHAALLR